MLLLPIIQVGCVRVIDPPGTPLMALRSLDRLPPPKATRPYQWIPLREMPRDFLRCALAAEDQRFFQHRGFDWREIHAARREADRTGRAPRGASTITMQCARSLFLWQGRSWLRKGLEAYYTFWMEAILPKRRILELYANVIEMGAGIYGVEAAAQSHYGISARSLDREQCAMLVAILPDPRRRNPRDPSTSLTARRDRILRMSRGMTIPTL